MRESFYLKSVRYHCSECGELAVRQFHVGAGFYVLVLLVVEECGVVYCYAFQTAVARQSVGADGSFATAAHHVADMYVAPFRHAFSVLWNCDLAVVLFHAVFLVGISAFKYYRLVLDVSHHDVAHVDVLRLSASADAALEAQSGCYLSQSFAKSVLPYYQVHHSHLLGTINDPQIYFLLHAIQKGWPISFSYRGKFKEGYPLNVWIDAYKREYICLWETTKYTTYRIHRMHHLRRLSHSIKTVQKKEKAIPQIILRIYYESMPAFQDSIAKIHEYFPNAVATAETTHTALCPIQIQDGRSLVPWLRTLHPAIEVVSDSTGKLRHRLHHDFEEALAQYE